MNKSIGIIEVVGMVTALACVDVLVKSAFVEVETISRVGSGLLAVIFKGDLASVQHAIEIGNEEAARHGELVASRVIARPYDRLDELIKPKQNNRTRN